jgi:hypothetical protein
MKCHACNRICQCPRTLHTGEAKVQVSLTAGELEHLLAQEPGRVPVDVYGLYTRLERALELLRGSR